MTRVPRDDQPQRQLFPNNGSRYDPRITGLIVTAVAALVTLQWGARTLAGKEVK